MKAMIRLAGNPGRQARANVGWGRRASRWLFPARSMGRSVHFSSNSGRVPGGAMPAEPEALLVRVGRSKLPAVRPCPRSAC